MAFKQWLKGTRPLLLDGGLATELESLGYDLSDRLWSARLLHDAPEAIKQVHRAYFDAGADMVLSASYQATVAGLVDAGFSAEKATTLLRRAIQLAKAVAAEYEPTRLVAASIGPYGAYLADGSEYRGDYGLTVDELVTFHRPRWRLLAAEAPDLMACETIPSFAEAQALAHVSAETPHLPTLISFSCRDSAHLHDGTPITEAAAFIQQQPTVTAIGVNCTPPTAIAGLIGAIRTVCDKPMVVYPNSGEGWDAVNRCWVGERDSGTFAEMATEWYRLGASVIGGCCRTTPAHIAELAALF